MISRIITSAAVAVMIGIGGPVSASEELTQEQIDYIDQLDQSLVEFEESLSDLGPQIIFPDQINDAWGTDTGFGVEYGFSGGGGSGGGSDEISPSMISDDYRD